MNTISSVRPPSAPPLPTTPAAPKKDADGDYDDTKVATTPVAANGRISIKV